MSSSPLPAYTMLIQPEELAALMRSAPGLPVICDCRFDLTNHNAGADSYAAGHIPGAAYLHLEDVLSGAKTGRNGRHPLPNRDALAAAMAALGTAENSQVVAYDAADSMFAARLWWLMRWLGHAKVAVLDGGMAAWRQAGLPIEEATASPPAAGNFTAGPPLATTIDYAALRRAKGDKLVLDARAPDRFRGENETLDATGGHIPGARNRFFRDNLDRQNRFKSAAALHDAYLEVLDGADPSAVVASCGSGVTACHNLLAMELANLPGAALYPGSWSEWSAQPDAPIATG